MTEKGFLLSILQVSVGRPGFEFFRRGRKGGKSGKYKQYVSNRETLARPHMGQGCRFFKARYGLTASLYHLNISERKNLPKAGSVSVLAMKLRNSSALARKA